MGRGQEFEEAIGEKLAALQANYPDRIRVEPQFCVNLGNQGKRKRQVIIDFRLEVEFEHEKQCYYLELQSRSKHGHELADKIEAVRHATELTTFSFIHESPLEKSVEDELRARNIVPYDSLAFERFLRGIELQLLQSRHSRRLADGRPRNAAEEGRLAELVKRLEGTEKHVRHHSASREQQHLMDEIAREVARDPESAIKEAMNWLKRR